MTRPFAPAVATLALMLLGCSGVTPAGGDDDGDGVVPRVAFLGTVQATDLCNRVGVVEIQMRARRVDCVDPGPCTLPATPEEIGGSRQGCPSTDAEVLLGVDVEHSGVYLVDAMAIFDVGDPLLECYAASGEALHRVTQADIDGYAERMLEPTGQPCPET